MAISELKKNGWLDLELNPADARKRIYKLKAPERAIEELGK